MKSEYGVGSTFTFYIKTCRTAPPHNSDMKIQIPDFDRVKDELPNACGSGTGLFDINEPPATMSNMVLSGTNKLEPMENGFENNVSHTFSSLQP